jgi:U2-associated protein SR140
VTRGGEADPSARGDDMMNANRRGQTGFTGFVAYMKRPHAEKAVSELDGLNWGGNVIRVAFSKAMPVPTRAIYGISHASLSRGHGDADASDLGSGNSGKNRSPSPRRGQRREGDRPYAGAVSSSKRSRSRSASPHHGVYAQSSSPPPKRSVAKDRWLAKVSTDQEDFIHSVARTVRDHGTKYEENLKAKHRSNPEYAFMFDDIVSRHPYS